VPVCYFDLSREVGVRKPETGIYRVAEERLSADDYAFVAGDLARDIRPAVERGWRGVYIGERRGGGRDRLPRGRNSPSSGRSERFRACSTPVACVQVRVSGRSVGPEAGDESGAASRGVGTGGAVDPGAEPLPPGPFSVVPLGQFGPLRERAVHRLVPPDRVLVDDEQGEHAGEQLPVPDPGPATVERF
jgi:hypothetical protein